ncbi:MAG TPA: HypC/HybG/HupF family hydrogenase formation chaperone [Oscillatoriaceae cyanobacterium M33_DOE_052]|uniref:HypC/HybG/HupF family hydrogenase formation chaperone n=1 Tax=Planktothricoides sp. SpSt-374 TaxID=2282167 RepID=A0A7C3VQV5_9CYAN|nr:HypC/HybG/HupF family hydrogenase formation chaperone [Oscillatoriaceae cyanobacterium M33_DOE_052]
MCLAVPGKIVSISHHTEVNGDAILMRSGKVSFGGICKEVSLAYVPEAQVGDYVIVHVGFALSVVEESEAVENLHYLQQIGA